MNQINEVRAEIEKFFNPALIIPSEHESDESPSRNYSLEVDVYAVDDSIRNWRIAVAIVTDRRSGEIVAQVKRNDDIFFHCWIERNGIEYLVCSEDVEGQTVIDLTHRRVESYRSDNEADGDVFVWTEFYPSPSRNKLAVVGCYWGFPYEVAIYDFREPLNLPLKRIQSVLLLGDSGYAEFTGWLNEDTFSLTDKAGNIQICQITSK